MTSRPKFVRLRVAFGGRKSSFAFCMMSFLPLDLLDRRRDGGRHRRCIALEAGDRRDSPAASAHSLLVRGAARGYFWLTEERDGSHARPSLERARVRLLLLLAGGGAEVPVVPPPSAARSLAAVTPVSIRPPWQAVLCFVVRRLLMLGRVEERQEIS